jgi:hypothetical protein
MRALVFVLLVGLSALAACSLLWRGIDVRLAQGSVGIAGTASIIDCEPTGRMRTSWRCDGEFTSDDGTVHIARLQLFPVFDERPSGTVDAQVSGPGATIATFETGSGWLVPFGGGLAFTALSAYWLYVGIVGWPARKPKQPAGTLKRRRR